MNAANEQQAETWEALYEKVKALLRQFGNESYLGEADYWILSDNYGFRTINLAVHKLSFLRPDVIHALQAVLKYFPTWEIRVELDVPGTEGLWPEMGLTVRADAVVDRLQRRYLPSEFQHMRFSADGPR
jgi:hypothetical protein